MITQAQFDAHLIERHGAVMHGCLKNATVGVAGIGGLGSHIALSLARAGLGRLILVDFDVVDLSNINRQAYTIKQIGQSKVEAIQALIRDVNPYMDIEVHDVRVTRGNACEIFRSADVVVEAFDNPVSKAELTEAILLETKKPLVAASGVAGTDSSNLIATRKVRHDFYLCGDGVSDIETLGSLVAPRVMVAAGHQANMALRIILGEMNA
ncbi:MAG: sulfur carrier protein ThiS adenylyltransferase ThiF [Clostridia bacterium]|nr:sulfur carrier protein ThiS adenylyltransferase ThiF [Clostridia bacterium]